MRNLNQMLRVVVLAIALTGSVLAAETKSAADTRAVLMAQGHEAFVAKNYAQARADYAKLQALPNATPAQRSLAQLRIAQCFLREGNLASAKAE